MIKCRIIFKGREFDCCRFESTEKGVNYFKIFPFLWSVEFQGDSFDVYHLSSVKTLYTTIPLDNQYAIYKALRSSLKNKIKKEK